MSFEFLISHIINGLSLSLPLTIVAAKIIYNNFFIKLSYFICSFFTGVLISLAESFIPGSQQFTFLLHGIVLMFFINANAKDYFKSIDLAVTITILFAMFVFTVTGAAYILMPWYLESDSLDYNIAVQIMLLVFAIIVRKNIDHFMAPGTFDIRLSKVNLAAKILIIFFISFLVPILFNAAVEKGTIGYYYGLMIIFTMMVIIGSYYRRYLTERITMLQGERRKVAIELTRREVETENVNKRYEEIINFKHYISGLYRSMIEFIVADDMPGLAKYYNDNIAPVNEMLNKEIGEYEQIRHIHFTLIRSRIIKLISDVSELRNISLYIWVENVISEVSMKDMDLFSILNTYIDNALEEVKEQEKGEIVIWMTQTYDRFIFEIKNSLDDSGSGPKPKSIYGGFEAISEIRENYPNVSTVTNVKFGMYSQKLEVVQI